MLRPATPLAILLFAAFVLLLLSVLSTPIIKAIPLGNYKSDNGVVNFGVFGYCRGNECSPIEIGYDASIFASSSSSSSSSSQFDLPSATRTRLSAILIVHPVAALLTLIMFIMSAVAHLHSPSHSSRYLCGLFIFGILTFLVCLLAFLIDVLLFVPHLAWGSYLVLAATILVFLSFIVSCAMRRTLVGRKARKKRIAENAEMSGENYYNRQAQQEATSVVDSSLQPTVPSISGVNGPSDKLPSFATYEKRDDRSSDERIPLTARTPSERSPNNAPLDMGVSDLPNRRSLSGSTQTLPTDPYGNPIVQPPDAYGMRRGPSTERMEGRGRGGPPGGYRGRGGNGRGAYGGGYGPPPNGRGGYSGPPNGRGAYGPPGRGSYGPGPNGRGGPGLRGGYNGGARGGRTPPPGYAGGAPYDGRTPPPGGFASYGPGRQMSPAPPRAPYNENPSMPSVSTGVTNTGGYQPYRPENADDLPRAESPPPLPGTDLSAPGTVGQAVAMDATTGSPAQSPTGFGQFNNHIRDSDTDVAGMLALQEARTSSAQQHDTTANEQGKFSQDEPYVPPRQAWNQGPGRASPSVPSPHHLSPGPQDPIRGTRPPPPVTLNGGNYYEDIDPRFAEPSPRTQQTIQEASGSFEDPHLAPGARSPTISERSGFTSVSQRGVNPRWNPPSQGYNQQIPPRKPVNRNDVSILNSNPDFQLPGRRGGSANTARGGARGGPGMIPGSAYPGAS
ncbi:SUR7/PalI family-domain-containing protein [Xylaria flabelliformis]|nr:SUR7/PalI family-domain-containing protein [Xylaria flabelliformis]